MKQQNDYTWIYEYVKLHILENEILRNRRKKIEKIKKNNK